MTHQFDKELALALDICARAGQLQLAGRTQLDIEIKDDRSPVTQIDRACETLIIESLSSAFPQDGFLGEETGAAGGTSGRTWVIDPIDGTRPYIRGLPTHSVLLALTGSSGEIDLGVIHLPALSVTAWGVRGGGAFVNGEPVRVSQTPTLERAMGSALGFVEKRSEPTGQRLFDLLGQLDYTYGFMDAYTYVNIARGATDLCVNLLDKPWDCAAAACIVREAGGEFSDITGADTIFGGTVVLTNGLLHEQVVSFFR